MYVYQRGASTELGHIFTIMQSTDLQASLILPWPLLSADISSDFA
jgi:hypothetical protein